MTRNQVFSSSAKEMRDAQAVDGAIAACYGSDDYREGVRAFLEKRAPRFQGR